MDNLDIISFLISLVILLRLMLLTLITAQRWNNERLRRVIVTEISRPPPRMAAPAMLLTTRDIVDEGRGVRLYKRAVGPDGRIIWRWNSLDVVRPTRRRLANGRNSSSETLSPGSESESGEDTGDEAEQ